MLNKKAIAILGAIFLLIIGTLGFLVYQRRSASTAAETPTPVANTETPPITEEPPTETPPEEPPTDVIGGAVKLTDDQIISPVLFFQGNGITYFTGTGQLFQTDLQNSSGKLFLNNKKELTISAKSGIRRILWPDSGNNFIAELQVNGNRTWSFYDSDKAAYVDLPNKITSISWMPGGQKIAYIWLDNNGKSALFTANANNTDYKKLSDMWENDNEIFVAPNGQSILYYQRNGSSARNPINWVSIDGKVFKSVVKDGYNSGVLWSPDSRRFLFGKKDTATQKYQLWVADTSSGEIKNLGVSGSTDKAVWSTDSQFLYAGIAPSTSSGLSQDKLVKITVGTGETKEYDLKVAVDMGNLFLNTGSQALFFKNLQDGGLYYIDLSQ